MNLFTDFRLRVLTALLLLSGLNALHAESFDRVAVELKDRGSFEVVYHRTSSNAAGAAFGGLIGAAIQSGIESGKDEDKRDELKAGISETACETELLKALQSQLDSKGIQLVRLTDSADTGEAARLMLDIDRCGFKVTETTRLEMSGFINLNMEVFLPQSKKPALEEDLYMTARDQYFYSDLVDSSELTESEFNSALRRAGKRIANKIYYQTRG